MSKLLIPSIVVLMMFAQVSHTNAQFPAAPEQEHAWLQKFVGEWDSEAKGSFGVGQPEMSCSGTMKASMLGGYWLISEQKNSVLGTEVDAVQTLGYDPETKKYVGTWVDSVMNHMWKYEGTVDEAGNILTLEADGPSFTDPSKKAKYRDVYEFKNADEFETKSQVLGDDGKWITFMSGSAKRKK